MHENYDLDLLLELVEQRKFRSLKELLSQMNEVDIAEFLDELDVEQEILVFRLLPKDTAAEVFTYLENTEDQEKLIGALSDRELREVLDELYLDDTVDIIEDMPANVVSRILRNTDASTRSQINQLLNYPKDSAGSIMTTEFVFLHPDATVEESFARIRSVGIDKETIYTCYVTQNRVLLGVVTVRRMLLSSYETRIRDIMETNVLSVNTHEDKEDVAQLLNKYDLSAIPVVDGDNRLVGIVTFDDAMDVIEEETTEDFEKMAAILPSDKPYLKTGVLETWRSRIPWLMLLMLSATFTGIIITSFESALAACVVLTSFIPMLSGTGGNSGSQSSVAVIRALSLDEIDFSDLVERDPCGGAVRRVPGCRQLRQDDGGRPVADAQPGGHPPGGPGGLPDPGLYRAVRQGSGLHSAHGGGEAGHRPGGDGFPLHHHHCGRTLPADLFLLRHLDPAPVSALPAGLLTGGEFLYLGRGTEQLGSSGGGGNGVS